jgi:hypothetical protein
VLFSAEERMKLATATAILCAECSELDFREGSIGAGSLLTSANFTGLLLYCGNKAEEYPKLDWDWSFDYLSE